MKNPFAILAEASDSIRPMKSSTAPDITRTTPTPSGRRVVTELNFDSPPKPIAEFAGRPDFPECALGEHIDIGGYAGVLVEIVNHSIKVKSPEGIMQSFNFPRLRQIYGPDPRREVNEVSIPVEQPRSVPRPPEPPPPAPKRKVITEPNFDQKVKAIRVFASRPDFPECALGEYVDIRGYSGVVVEIANQSLTVMSRERERRRFDESLLRRLYGRP